MRLKRKEFCRNIILMPTMIRILVPILNLIVLANADLLKFYYPGGSLNILFILEIIFSICTGIWIGNLVELYWYAKKIDKEYIRSAVDKEYDRIKKESLQDKRSITEYKGNTDPQDMYEEHTSGKQINLAPAEKVEQWKSGVTVRLVQLPFFDVGTDFKGRERYLCKLYAMDTKDLLKATFAIIRTGLNTFPQAQLLRAKELLWEVLTRVYEPGDIISPSAQLDKMIIQPLYVQLMIMYSEGRKLPGGKLDESN